MNCELCDKTEKLELIYDGGPQIYICYDCIEKIRRKAAAMVYALDETDDRLWNNPN